MAEVNRLEWDAYIRDSELMRSIQRIENRMEGMVDRVKKSGQNMEDVFSRMAKVAAGFFTLNQAQNFINQLVRVRSEFQQLDIAFTTMLGSKEKADQLTKDLIEFAAITPFGMKDAANAAKQLLAYGSSAESVKDELRMLGDVAAGTSQPIGELVYLYGTLRTQGRAYLMDIRQFAGRGIPIYQELAKVLKVGTDQVNDLVSAGKVGFAEVEQAFKNMTAAGSMFGGLMEAQSKTIQGELERLGDAYDIMLNEMGQKTEGLISTVIQGAAKMVESYERVLDILTGLVVIYGSYRAALIATAALNQINAARLVGMTAAEMLHYGAIVAKTKAMAALNAVMAASPLIAMTALIAALSAAIYSLTQVTNATTAAQEKLNEAHDAGAKKADAERRSVEQLIGVLKSNTASAEQKKSAYDKLLAQTGGILSSFNQEEIATGKATAALDEYILKIREAASARKAFDEFNALAEQMDELNRKGYDSLDWTTKLGRSLKNTFAPTSQGIGLGDWGRSLFSSDFASQQIVDQEKNVLDKSMDELKKEYGSKWEEILTGVKVDDVVTPAKKLEKDLSNFNEMLKSVANKAELDSLKKSVTEYMEALAPTDPQLAQYRSKLEQLNKIEQQYSVSSGKGKEGKENAAFQSAERYRSMLADIEKAQRDYALSQMESDQQEIASTKDKYNALRDEIRKFNADPRNKTKIDGKGINELELQELNTIRQRQANTARLKQYQEDYQNYVRYQQLKKEAGEKYADDQLGGYSGTVPKMQAEINALQGKKFTQGLSPVEEQHLKELEKLLEAHNKRVNTETQDRYVEALKMAQSFNDKRLEIEKKYQQARESLGKDITPEQEQELQRKESKDLSQLASTELQESDAWTQLFADLDYLTIEQIEKLIREIEDNFDDLSGNFNPIDLAAIRERLNEAKDIVIESNPFKQLGISLNEIFKGASKESEQTSDNIKEQWTKLAKATDKSFEFIANAVNSAGFLKDVLGETGQVALGTLQAVSGAAIGVALAIQGVEQSSVILAVIQAALAVVQAVFAFLDGAAKRRNEELKKEQEYYNALSETFDILIDKQKELFSEKSGKGAMEAYKEALDLVNSKQIANRKSLEAWFAQGASWKSHSNWYNYDKELGNVLSRQNLLNMSGKEWEDLLRNQPELWARLPEEVRAFGNSMIDAKSEAEELRDAIQESLTGISLDDVKSEFDNLFSQADLTFGDISDSFYKHMQKAVLRMVQDGKMTDSIKKWYDNVMNAMEDENLTKAESDALKAEYQAIVEAGQKRTKEIMDLIGYEGESSSSLGSEGISRATEEQFSEYLGINRSIFGINKQQLVAELAQSTIQGEMIVSANNRLLALNAIQINTFNTAQEALKIAENTSAALQHLKNIDSSLGGRYA